MVSSAIPDAPPLAWPALRRPAGSAKLVYLDQNHWVHLAQADTGHRGNRTQADGWELQAIASSVIGGTSLFGAVGSVHGPLIGSFILTTINNGANLLNLNPFWQRIITGALIIIVVYFDTLRQRRR